MGLLAAFAWLDAPYHDDVAIDPGGDGRRSMRRWRFSKSRRARRSHVDRRRRHRWRRRARGGAWRAEVMSAARRQHAHVAQARCAAPVASPLPDGYTLRHVETDADFEQRAFVECDAFGGSGLTGEMWRTFAERLPNYRADLDLLAVAADGGGASAATFWYDEATRCGEIEAVGTAKAHLRRGVGKAVISEGLRRLHALGATTAVVQTTIGNDAAIALYRSCGFEVVGHDYAWVKQLPARE